MIRQEFVISEYNDILKSDVDTRLYRGLDLKNGMKVMLISDPSTDKSAAALDIHIGYMCDPDDLPGLAHLCEHALFQASKKYPNLNEFNTFLKEHFGDVKAFTSCEHTNFSFDVDPKHLHLALDRFSDFFVDPLFLESNLEAAIDTVNAEYETNLQSDARRLEQWERSCAKSNHAYRKFGDGNKLTLNILPKARGIDVQEELLKFYNKWYSSNIMTLIVLGRETLHELTAVVVPLFSKIQNKDVVVPEWLEHPFGPEQVKFRGYLTPLHEIQKLNVDFPISDRHEYYSTYPVNYISYLLDHEGPGTLVSELKSLQWINTLMASHTYHVRGFASFLVNADLTEEGIKHVDDILAVLFQYLNLIREEGCQEWRFKEYRDLSVLNFRFQCSENQQSYTSSLAEKLHDLPVKDVLSGPHLLREYHPDMIQDLLNRLTPENIRVVVLGKGFSDITDSQEQWYGIEYKLEKIEECVLEKWKNAELSDQLKLPLENPFIPVNFKLMPVLFLYSQKPVKIRDSQLCRVWFKQDNEFRLPKAILGFKISTPLAYADPLHCNMMYMFIEMFKEDFSKYSYAAEIAGHSYNMSSTKYGLFLVLKGYNDKLHILVNKILTTLLFVKVQKRKFAAIKEEYIRFLRNFHNQQPYKQAMHYRKLLISERFWSNEELLEAAEDISMDKLKEMVPQIFAKIHVESLMIGNLTKRKALSLIKFIEDTLLKERKSQPFKSTDDIKGREYELQDGSHYLFEKPSMACRCSAIEVYFQCGPQEPKMNMAAELFTLVVSEPCYHILRIHEQIGYVVHCGLVKRDGILGVRFLIQSDRNPAYVDTRVEAFLLHVGKYLENISDEEFLAQKASLINQVKQTPQNMEQKFSKYWSEVSSWQYNFDRDQEELASLQSLTKHDLCHFYKENLFHSATRRKKLTVQIVSMAESATRQQLEGSPREIDLQKDAGLFPVPEELRPYEIIHDVGDFKNRLRRMHHHQTIGIPSAVPIMKM